jgi:hypothetical protein
MNAGIDERCIGYAVESVDGRIGSVAAILPPRGGRGEAALLLKTGLWSCSVSAVSSKAIERVDAERRRVVLRAPSRARASVSSA